MIFGILLKNNDAGIDRKQVFNIFDLQEANSTTNSTYTDSLVSFISKSDFGEEAFQESASVASKDRNLAVVFTGRIYNKVDIETNLGGLLADDEISDTASLLLLLYRRFGLDFVHKLNGKFAIAIWDKSLQRLFIFRDRLGIEPLYYYMDETKIIFSSSIHHIFKYPGIVKELNFKAVIKFLLFNYNPELETFFKKVYRIRPGHYLVTNNDNMRLKRYWRLSFSDQDSSSEDEISENLLDHLRDAISLRTNANYPYGAFLSGGLDSSTVVALTAEKTQSHLKTFSYACQSESFNESHYARAMAEFVGSKHNEIEYKPDDILLMPEIVGAMNEPFCDVGINIATYLLGREANRNGTACVLTGDGGDELFGGHPVYEADKIARFVDNVPDSLKIPIFDLLSKLPDSDKKKNLVVKLKRFSESLKFPKELLTHRWRIYYNVNDLRKILSKEYGDFLQESGFYEDILFYNEEADGNDPLSRSLYSDYQTAVDFYLRRNDLNRRIGLETRFPMLDHHLVEFCAKIPSELKIRGWFETKYILKKSINGVLPDTILHRKDKLGHSIPLKNWMRDNKTVKDFILGHLSEEKVRNRGFFNIGYINHMVNSHLLKRVNNSHRLWTLAVLEMWLQYHFDH